MVGTNTHIGLGAKIGASCLIKSLSLVQQGRRIADSTMIMGLEVTELEPVDEAIETNIENETTASFGWHLLFLLISFIPAIMIILIAIMIIFLASYKTHTMVIALILYPVLMSIGQVIVAVCVRPLRYLLIGKRAEPGWEIVHSKSFLRRNVATSLYHSSTSDGTVLSRLITRFAFGAEIDVKNHFSPQPEEPDLTRIGRCTFGANGVRVRNMSFHRGGVVQYGKVSIGDHSMILDRAVISPNTSIKKNVMVGPITSVNENTTHEKGALLLGTPALILNRKVSDGRMEIKSEPMVSVFSFAFACMVS